MNQKPLTREQALRNIMTVVNQAKLSREEWAIMNQSIEVVEQATMRPEPEPEPEASVPKRTPKP